MPVHANAIAHQSQLVKKGNDACLAYRQKAAIICKFGANSFEVSFARPDLIRHRQAAEAVSSGVLRTNQQISRGKTKELILLGEPVESTLALPEQKTIVTDVSRLAAPDVLETDLFHEGAHIFYRYGVNRQDDITLGTLYWRLMKVIGIPPYFPFPLEIGSMGDYVEDPRLGLFHEKNYAGMGNGGHAHNNHEELFASLSSILKFAPLKFMENLNSLGVVHSDFQKLATRAAIQIIKCWRPAEVLSSIITDYFNPFLD